MDDAESNVAFAKGWAGASGEVGTGQADRRLADGHAVRPTWPVTTVVFEQPQRAVLGLVGWAGTDLAEQFSHSVALPWSVNFAELGSTVSGVEGDSSP